MAGGTAVVEKSLDRAGQVAIDGQAPLSRDEQITAEDHLVLADVFYSEGCIERAALREAHERGYIQPERLLRRRWKSRFADDARQSPVERQRYAHRSVAPCFTSCHSIERSSHERTSSSMATSVPVLAFNEGPVYLVGRAFASRQVITVFAPCSSRSWMVMLRLAV